MRIFITGATGFIGSALTKELIAAGHHVLGLCRSEAKAGALAATGAEVIAGTVEDSDLIKAAAGRADAVVHLAFNHDFSRYLANCEDDRRVIAALGSALVGSDRPLLVTSGTAVAAITPGDLAREDAPALGSDVTPRAASEEAARAVAADGVNVSIVRLPQVHDPLHQGLISPMIAMFRQKGVCAYVGDGRNRWAAGHYLDVARLYRLAVERGEPNAIYNAVGEEGVAMREIIEVIGARLGLPVQSITAEEAPAFFGWLGRFVGYDMPASSAITREKLGWQPVGPSLLEDLAHLPV